MTVDDFLRRTGGRCRPRRRRGSPRRLPKSIGHVGLRYGSRLGNMLHMNRPDLTHPDLAAITSTVDRIERATRDRNTAMRAARDNGHTWRAIADAAGMTQHGVRLALRNAELRAAAGE